MMQDLAAIAKELRALIPASDHFHNHLIRAKLDSMVLFATIDESLAYHRGVTDGIMLMVKNLKEGSGDSRASGGI